MGKNRAAEEEDEDEEEEDDDAFEALFAQLEEDLKKDDPSLFDGDDEITEEDLAKLDAELAAIDEEIAEVFDMAGYEIEDRDDDDEEILVEVDEDEDEDEEEQPLQLRNWQLRRLALALKTGRRKTNVCYELSYVIALKSCSLQLELTWFLCFCQFPNVQKVWTFGYQFVKYSSNTCDTVTYNFATI